MSRPSAATAARPQRMPSSNSYSSNTNNYAEQRSGYRTSSSDEMDLDNTSSSYNGRAYPTSEAHLTRSAEEGEYGYNMAQYQAQQRQRQPSLPSSVHTPEIQYSSRPAGNTQYASYRTHDDHNYNAGVMHDKMEFASPPLSDLDMQHASSNAPAPSSYADKDGPYRTDIAHIYGQSDKQSSAKAGPQSPAIGAAGQGVSSIVRGYGTPHQIAYLSVVLLQTLATAAMIAIVWVKIRAGTPGELRHSI